MVILDHLIIHHEGALNLNEVLIEPIDGADHQVGAVQVGLYLDLNFRRVKAQLSSDNVEGKIIATYIYVNLVGAIVNDRVAPPTLIDRSLGHELLEDLFLLICRHLPALLIGYPEEDADRDEIVYVSRLLLIALEAHV